MPFSFFFTRNKVEAAWWNDSWSYRKSIQITNNTTAETNVYVSVTLDTSDTTKFQADCGDLRFTKNNGELLPYYIYSGCGTASTVVYASFDTFPAGAQTLYYYYGNPSVPDGFSSPRTRNGSITQANMKISIVNGTAFTDFSAPDVLTSFTGSKLTISDSAGKKLTGYIKAAGTGETLGSELLTNGNFTNWTGDNPDSWIINGGPEDANTFITQSPVGQCRIYSTSTAIGIRQNSSALGSLNKIVLDVKSVTSGSLKVPDAGGYADPAVFNSIGDGQSRYFTLGTSLNVNIDRNASPTDVTIDNVSLKQVTSPSATGVTIVSSLGGSTYNWASEETGFNRNDSSGYTYSISPEPNAVTQANMKMSIVNGTAFADFTAPGTLTNNLNSKVIITDSASKKLTGFIKAAGTGETYGSELLSNPGFETGDPPTNYTTYYATLSSVVDNRPGSAGTKSVKVLRLAGNSTNDGRQGVTAEEGGLYLTTGWRKNAGSVGTRIRISSQANNDPWPFVGVGASSLSTDWNQASLYWVDMPTQTSYAQRMEQSTTADGQFAYWDDFSCTQVLTPSTSGATITSTSNGGTFNWASEESGFNRNDSGNYTYTIYPLAFSVEASNYTVGSFGSEEKSTAPVGYWSFDEGQGTLAHDGTSNKNDGTITGATWKQESECVSGKCLEFSGTNNYVALTDTSKYNFGSADSFTVSTWFRINNQVSDYEVILGKASGSSIDGYMLKHSQNGNIAWVIEEVGSTDNSTLVSSGYDYRDNKWHYAVGFVDRTNNKSVLYIDGVKRAEDTNISDVTNITNSYAFEIGGLEGTPVNIAARLDEVKIYLYARSAAQIKMDYNAGLAGMGQAKEGSAVSMGGASDKWMSDGLVGHWKMDETSGTTVADASGNGNTGTLTNAQEIGTSDASGNSTTTLIDTDGTLSATDDAYNGMILRNTSACGGIASGTERLISDYTGATKTFMVGTAWANAPDSCPYEVRHQVGGKFGSGVGFDGVDDYMQLSNLSVDTTAGAKNTVSFWMYWDGVASKMPFGWNSYDLYISSTCFGFNTAEGNVLGISTSAVPVNSWSYITAVFYNGVPNSDNNSVYINGQKQNIYACQGSTTLSRSVSTSARIGTWPSGGYYFDGKIDDFRIYNRALSPDEVKDLYNWAPGPVGHWKMDERSGQTVIDSSGYGNNGTLGAGATADSADPTWENGQFGAGLKFDGADDRVGVEDSDSTDIGLSNLTISFWMKNNNVSSLQRIIAKLATNASGAGYFVSTVGAGNQLYFQAQDGVNSLNPIFNPYLKIDNLWHNVSVTLDRSISSGVKFYFDGVSQTCTSNCSYNATLLGNISNSLKLALGNRSATDPGSPMNGALDDVKIYNYARTPEQIMEDIQGDIGGTNERIGKPMKYYKLNEGYGTSIKDENAGGTDGTFYSGDYGTADSGTTTTMLKETTNNWLNETNDFYNGWKFKATSGAANGNISTITDYRVIDLVNNKEVDFSPALTGFASGDSYQIYYDDTTGPTWTNDGKFGKALYFDGKDDYVGFTSNFITGLNTGNNLSISAWINPDDVSTTKYIFVENGPISFSLYPDRLRGTVHNGTSWCTAVTTPAGTIRAGQWQYVTISYDNSNIKLYVNGTLLGTQACTGLQTTSGFAVLGNYNGGGQNISTGYYFKGYIDDFKIYNYALTSEDIKVDMNQGKSLMLGSAGMSSTGVSSNTGSQEYCIPGDATSCAGPVGEWKMEEGSGQSAEDSSGNGNTGQLGSTSGADAADPVYATGKIGKALQFDGSDDIVNAGNAASLNITGTLTISAWIYPKSFGGGSKGRIVDKDTNTTGFWLSVEDIATTDGLWFGLDNGDNAFDETCGAANITTLNQWQYVAITLDSDKLCTFYVDGVRVGTPTTLSKFPNSSLATPLFIGARSLDALRGFDGLIDQVRVYNYARTPAQIVWEYNQGKPVAHWKMDECQGATVNDSSGNGNNGTLNLGASGNTTPGTCTAPTDGTGAWYDGRNGKRNASLDFDGTDDYVEVSDSSSLQPASLTISAWVKQGSSGAIMTKPYSTTSDKSFSFKVGSTGSTFFEIYTNPASYPYWSSSAGAIPSDGAWHHFIVTFSPINGDSSDSKIYIDGKQTSTTYTANSYGVGKTLRYSSLPLNIGRNNAYVTPIDYFSGQIDDAQIYNYALTPLQVKTLYNGGAVRFGN